MAEEDVANNSNVELASHIIDNSLHQSTGRLFVLGFRIIALNSVFLLITMAGIKFNSYNSANTSKEFYAHISKKEIRIFGKGKVPLSFAVYRYIAKLATMYNRDFYCAILLMCFYCFV